MFRFAIISLVLSFLILGNAFVIQADEADTPKDTDDKKTEETKPEEDKPARLYDLKPVYTENMSWKEEVKLKSVMYFSFSDSFSSNTDDTMTMTLKAQITEYKDNVPTKVKYSECTGSGSVTRSFGNNNEHKYEYKINKGLVEADVKDDLTLKVTKDENLEDDILLVFPGSVLSWFVAPIQAVKVGDIWKSKVLPVSKEAFESEDGTFDNIEGKFKLEQISEKDDVDIAHILWTGKCKLTQYQNIGPYDVTWKIKILFDLTNKRVMSTDGEASAELDNGDKGGLKLTINRKAIYAETTKPKEDKPIKPKNEDDE